MLAGLVITPPRRGRRLIWPSAWLTDHRSATETTCRWAVYIVARGV
jgi:hypothetical protein